MQLKLDTDVLEEREVEARVTERSQPETDRNDGLLNTAMPIMMAAYGFAIAIVGYTFWRSGDTLLSIAICVVYMGMFFGVPTMMAKVRNRHDQRWCSDTSESLSDRVEIFGGNIGRREALLQMVIVPLVVAFAFAAFAVIWVWVKP